MDKNLEDWKYVCRALQVLSEITFFSRLIPFF